MKKDFLAFLSTRYTVIKGLVLFIVKGSTKQMIFTKIKAAHGVFG